MGVCKGCRFIAALLWARLAAWPSLSLAKRHKRVNDLEVAFNALSSARHLFLLLCVSVCGCVCVVCCVFCVVCCQSSERGSFFVSSRFFINFAPLFLFAVVVYSGHNMIIFLWPTFNLFAHVSATCNGSVREIGREGEREREYVFLLPQYRHLSAHAFIFVRENCQPVA